LRHCSTEWLSKLSSASYLNASHRRVKSEYLERAQTVTGLPPSACFSSLTDALAAVEADTVVVVVHAQLHGRFIREALLAGKHVMVEKPLTCDLTEAEELIALAERQGRRLMVTQQMRYLPVERTLRRLLAEEAYGRLGFGHYVAYKARGAAYPNSDHMHLWQMAVHELDELLAMINRPVLRVAAREFQPVWGNWPSESTISAVLEFRGGPTISYLSTSDARAFSHEFRVECERGALIHRANRVGGEGKLVIATREGEQPLALDPALDRRAGGAGMADLFARYVLNGVEPEVSGRRNLRTLRLCDAIIRSSQTSQAVELADGVALERV
jgi:predicted dehydrogenase